MLRRRESGASNIIFVGVALPIIILALVGLVDLTRGPLVKRDLQQALMNGALGAERHYYEQGEPNQPAVPPNYLLSPFFPAPNNLCRNTGDPDSPPVNCSVTGLRLDILTPQIEQGILDAACDQATKALQNRSGILNYSRVGIRFYLLSAPVSAGDGEIEDAIATPSLSSAEDCSGLGYYTHFDSSGAFASQLIGSFGARISSLSQPVGYHVLAQPTSPWLSSYWLLGIAFGEYDHTFSMFGERGTVSEYFIRPIEVVSGIQNRTAG